MATCGGCRLFRSAARPRPSVRLGTTEFEARPRLPASRWEWRESSRPSQRRARTLGLPPRAESTPVAALAGVAVSAGASLDEAFNVESSRWSDAGTASREATGRHRRVGVTGGATVGRDKIRQSVTLQCGSPQYVALRRGVAWSRRVPPSRRAAGDDPPSRRSVLSGGGGGGHRLGSSGFRCRRTRDRNDRPRLRNRQGRRPSSAAGQANDALHGRQRVARCVRLQRLQPGPRRSSLRSAGSFSKQRSTTSSRSRALTIVADGAERAGQDRPRWPRAKQRRSARGTAELLR